jgi:hypothetical protein
MFYSPLAGCCTYVIVDKAGRALPILFNANDLILTNYVPG